MVAVYGKTGSLGVAALVECGFCLRLGVVCHPEASDSRDRMLRSQLAGKDVGTKCQSPQNPPFSTPCCPWRGLKEEQ